MDASDKIGAKRVVDGTVARDPVHGFEAGRLYGYLEMAFAALLKPRVAPMALAVVDDLQLGRLESGLKPCPNFLCN